MDVYGCNTYGITMTLMCYETYDMTHEYVPSSVLSHMNEYDSF